MNVIKYILLSSIFLTAYTSANVDISAEIVKLKNAKKSEKYIIMNKIKIQIAKLNSTQRAKAIAQLRGATSNTGSSTQLPQSLPSMTTPSQSIPQIPVPPVIGNIPVPVPPPMISPPVTVPLSVQSMPKGGQ
jgi:hypothetical protein